MDWLQTVCDKYAAAKYGALPTHDVSFLYCSGCGIPVNAFGDPSVQQFACTVCATFICADCTHCLCGAEQTMVSDGDARIGRLSEYVTRGLVHRCSMCPEFFLVRQLFVEHVLRDHIAVDPAPASVTVRVTRQTVVPGIGTLVRDGATVSGTFGPYPRVMTSGGVSVAGYAMALRSDGEVHVRALFNARGAKNCARSVAYHTHSEPQTLVRPMCCTQPRAICRDELAQWLAVCQSTCVIGGTRVVGKQCRCSGGFLVACHWECRTFEIRSGVSYIGCMLTRPQQSAA